MVRTAQAVTASGAGPSQDFGDDDPGYDKCLPGGLFDAPHSLDGCYCKKPLAESEVCDSILTNDTMIDDCMSQTDPGDKTKSVLQVAQDACDTYKYSLPDNVCADYNIPSWTQDELKPKHGPFWAVEVGVIVLAPPHSADPDHVKKHLDISCVPRVNRIVPKHDYKDYYIFD